MTRRALAAICLILLPGVAAAQNPVTWKRLSPKSMAVAPAAVAQVTIGARIQKGWRIYSFSRKKGGPYGMTITLLPGSRATISGQIRTPVPTSKFDSSFRMTTEAFSGTPVFTVPLRAPSAGTTETTIRIRYQACSDKFCLPPRNALLPVTMKIVPPG